MVMSLGFGNVRLKLEKGGVNEYAKQLNRKGELLWSHRLGVGCLLIGGSNCDPPPLPCIPWGFRKQG